MAKPQEKTAATAVRPIALPPLSQHLRELAIAAPSMGRDCAQFDSRCRHLRLRLVRCACCVQLLVRRIHRAGRNRRRLIPRALRETQPKSVGVISAAANLVRDVVTWIFLVGIVGLP